MKQVEAERREHQQALASRRLADGAALAVFIFTLGFVDVFGTAATIGGAPLAQIAAPGELSGLSRLVLDELAPLLLIAVKLGIAKAAANSIHRLFDHDHCTATSDQPRRSRTRMAPEGGPKTA